MQCKSLVNDSCFQQMFYHKITKQTQIHCMQNNHVKWLILNENKVLKAEILIVLTFLKQRYLGRSTDRLADLCQFW